MCLLIVTSCSAQLPVGPAIAEEESTGALEIGNRPIGAALSAECEVQSAILEQFYLSSHEHKIIVLDTAKIRLGPDETVESIAAFAQANLSTSISDHLLTDYIQKNKNPELLCNLNQISSSYIMQDRLKLNDVLGETGSWDQLVTQYPQVTNIVAFSHVGFNEKMNQALVYTDAQGNFGSGQGLFFVLESRDESWIIIDSIVVWIS